MTLPFMSHKFFLMTDYWDQYKHYFIRKLDSFSFNTFDEFYNCATEILEQQELMKNFAEELFLLYAANTYANGRKCCLAILKFCAAKIRSMLMRQLRD